MKCIHCATDSKLKDRKAHNGCCAQCGHRFAFEPTTDPRKVSDGLFERCIKDVSGDGTLFFTEAQLWYELNRRLLRRMPTIPVPFGIGAGVCGVGGVIGLMAGTGFLLPVGIVAGIVTLVVGAQVGKKNPKPRRVVLPLDEFRTRYLMPYRGTHGAIEKLLPEIDLSWKPRRAEGGAATALPSDLASYSFDRALVTEHADMAAMLVANRFHFENNCAILSVDGRYPENGRFKTIQEMLKQNPALTVFAVHDASVDGLRLSLTLRGETWFPNPSVRLVDLGLRPLQVMKGGSLLTPGALADLPPEVAARLTPEENAWLKAGDSAALASLRPARLMRAIYQGFNQANAMPTGGGADEGGVIFVGGPGYGYGGDAWSDGGTVGGDSFAADSFG